jgi:superfamily I DNA/RNA helicase
MGKAISFSDIAVLFRAGSQIPALAEAFSRSGIPYRLLSESPLQSRFFKAGLRMLRLISSPASPMAMRLALSDIFKSEKDFPVDQKHLKDWLTQRRDDERAGILLRLLEKKQELGALEICEKVFSMADAAEGEAAEREMVKELAIDLVKRKARQTGIRMPEQILEVLTLASSQDFYDPEADRVSLLTIHSAKGLEFEVVFIVGCEEGIIPHISARTEQEIEEEKRLFYVALTRAKNLIYLSRAKKRASHGKISESKPSRFMARIKQDLLDKLKPTPLPSKPKSSQLGLFDK